MFVIPEKKWSSFASSSKILPKRNFAIGEDFVGGKFRIRKYLKNEKILNFVQI